MNWKRISPECEAANTIRGCAITISVEDKVWPNQEGYKGDKHSKRPYVRGILGITGFEMLGTMVVPKPESLKTKLNYSFILQPFKGEFNPRWENDTGIPISDLKYDADEDGLDVKIKELKAKKKDGSISKKELDELKSLKKKKKAGDN